MKFPAVRRGALLGWCRAGLLTAWWACAPTTATAATLPVGAHHVRIDHADADAAALVRNVGGTLLFDYEAFALYTAPVLPAALADRPGVEICDQFHLVRLHAGALDTSLPAAQAARGPVGAFPGRRLHLIQFAGPVQPAWHSNLLAAGARLVGYLPENAYLVYGDAGTLATVQARAATAPEIQWDGPFRDEYRLHPAALAAPAGAPADFLVQCVADPEANAASLRLMDELRLAPLARRDEFLGCLNVVVRLDPAQLSRLAAQPDVISILPWAGRRHCDERQAQIIAGNLAGALPAGPGYLAWLAAQGFTQSQFTASGFAVDVTDSGLDNGTPQPNHFGLFTLGAVTNASRVLYNYLAGTPSLVGSTLAGCDGHGTLNAHLIGGYDAGAGFPFADTAGYHYGLGVCPFVRLGSSVIFDPIIYTKPYLPDLQSTAYQAGARVSNNSWGALGTAENGLYDADSQAFDALVRDAQPAGSAHPAAGNQEMVIVFAAGNGGSAPGSVTPPGTAKNVITVGASDSVQAFGGGDGSGIPDSQAAGANDLAPFSSRGPCADGRQKPDLVAPGTHLSGGVVQAANPGPLGTADSCFNAAEISGGPGGAPFFPAGQQFYTASSGTSHATPAVAGAAALFRQSLLNLGSNAPSPALTKAFLVNSARYLTGAGAADTLPSPGQGFGALDLAGAFTNTARLYRDELPVDLFTATGQARAFTGAVADASRPFRVTLAWTDAPGGTAGAAYNNNLDLQVTVGGRTYKGNVFNGAWSAAGGAADTRNNLESVFLPPGTSGPFTVRILAAGINSEGVPNNAYLVDQDFALVVDNAIGAPNPVPAGSVLLQENCAPANGVVDPGETVTLGFALQNAGTVATTNLTATLLAGGGVPAPSGPAVFGALVPGGGAVTQAFTFTAVGVCGGAVTATLQLQDGALNLGTAVFTLPLGQFTIHTLLAQNFDDVTPPALPGGWSSAAQLAGSRFVTTTAGSDSPPLAATVGTPANPGLEDLVSPAFFDYLPAAILAFRHNYNFEAAPPTGYDGGVLEIQLGGGGYQDILAAGGAFLAGGYTLTLDTDAGQQLNGRAAWSGNSGGWLTTRVQLPAAAYLQSVQLRWRVGTDTGNTALVGVGGWSVDSISLTDPGVYSCCTETAALVVSAPAGANPALLGQNLTFSLQITNAGSAAATNLVLTDLLPAGTAFVAASPGLTFTNGQLSSALPFLAGYTATNFFLTLQPTTPGWLTNSFTATTATPQSAAAVTNAVTLVLVVAPPVLTVAATGPGGSLVLQTTSATGLNYTLEATAALAPAPGRTAWQPVPGQGPLPGTGGLLTFTDAAPATGGARFYRVVAR